eukprot:Partr_v1_DN27568_c3_g2_i1_m30554 putative glutathione gammaglutamylcysteinyltransferase
MMINRISRCLSRRKLSSISSATVEESPQTFYRRDLPPSLVSFTSAHGKSLFTGSLKQGLAENYFQLVGNFTTQSEPAFCGPGSLAMVLNALELDPGKRWKGVWRWYEDTNLECCSGSADAIKRQGITFREFSCLARCNGLEVVAKRADLVSFDEFSRDLRAVCSSSDRHLVVSFSRSTLGQTGDGHFSPVGAYNAEENMALVLDTARFKYPSYFAPVDLLYESMQPIDKETGLPRGYFILTRNHDLYRNYKPLSLCKLTKSIGVSNPNLANLFCREIPARIDNAKPQSLLEVLKLVLTAIPAEYSALISVNSSSSAVDLAAPVHDSTLTHLSKDHDRDLHALISETQKLDLFVIIKRALVELGGAEKKISDIDAALATIFILSSPLEIYRTLSNDLMTLFRSHRNLSMSSETLRMEVERIEDQLSTLLNDYCQCAQRQQAFSSLPGVRLNQKARCHLHSS